MRFPSGVTPLTSTDGTDRADLGVPDGAAPGMRFSPDSSPFRASSAGPTAFPPPRGTAPHRR